MKTRLALLALLATVSCQSTSPAIVDADPARREALLSAMTALEGDWRGTSDDMELHHEFRLTAGGSAVREIMFPGSDHEMVNMYSLDGNDLVMTHYCGAGNQPHMRAQAVQDGQIEFAFDGVSDLKAADETYMGEMTLVFIDENTIEERWTSLKGGVADHHMTMRLTRR